jgi:hypothetical protein
MAISWVVLLQSVPWAEVISNAPKLAEGAKNLWNTVARKPLATDASGARPVVSSAEPRTVQELAQRIVALESTVADLHAQMLASSELIKQLAELNTQLVARIEANRVRTLRMTVAMAAIAVVAVVAIVLAAR